MIKILNFQKFVQVYENDNPAMTNELAGTGIEFELVDPKLYESLSKSEHDTALKRNKEAAKKYGFMIQGDYAVLFHGTSKKNMKAIQKSGTLRQGTWMTPELDVAKKYSRQVTSRASDSIIDTFVVYLGSLIYSPNDEGGYFQSNEELHYKEGKYVPENFKRGGPDGLHGIYESVDNMDRYKENGIVLIHGEELPDGTHKLYAANLKKVLSYQRMKMDGEEGQAAKMVLLYPDTYRITRTPDGQFKAGKVMSGNKMTGLKSRRVVLNNNKTPLHWESTKYQYFPMLFKNIGDVIGNMPNIKWYN